MVNINGMRGDSITAQVALCMACAVVKLGQRAIIAHGSMTAGSANQLLPSTAAWAVRRHGDNKSVYINRASSFFFSQNVGDGAAEAGPRRAREALKSNVKAW